MESNRTGDEMKRSILILTMVTLAAAALPGQSEQATPQAITRIHGHVLGESVAEWIVAYGSSMGAVCSSKEQKYLCEKLNELAAGKQREKDSPLEGVTLYTQGDDVYTYRPYGPSVDANPKPVIDWRFAGGHLTAAHMVFAEPEPPEEINRQIGFLSEQYGPPFSDKLVQVQNGYGAQFTLRKAYWGMEDGVGIAAAESFFRAATRQAGA
jgi:hypothetical protein